MSATLRPPTTQHTGVPSHAGLTTVCTVVLLAQLASLPPSCRARGSDTAGPPPMPTWVRARSTRSPVAQI